MISDDLHRSRLAVFESEVYHCPRLKAYMERHYEPVLLQPERVETPPSADAIVWGASVTVEQCRAVLAQMHYWLPQLMIREHYDRRLRRQARRLGILSFLPADFQQEELLQAVRNILQHGHHARGEREKTLFAQALISEIDQQLKTQATLDVNSLCRRLNLSQSGLYRRVKAATGKSTQQLMLQRKCHRAAALLREGDQPISEVAYASGFNSPTHLSAAFRKRYGCSPQEYRHQKQGDTPHHADD